MDRSEAARVIAQTEAAAEAVLATGCTIDARSLVRIPAGVHMQLWHCGGLGPVGIAIRADVAPDEVAAEVYDGMTHGQPHGRFV